MYSDKELVRKFLPGCIERNPGLLEKIEQSPDPFLLAVEIIKNSPEYASNTLQNQASENELMADWIRNAPTSEFLAYTEKVKNEIAGQGPKPWRQSSADPEEPVPPEDLSNSYDQARPNPPELLLADRLLYDGHTLSWISEKDGKERTKRKWPANSGDPVKGYEPIPPGTYYTDPKKDLEKKSPVEDWGLFHTVCTKGLSQELEIIHGMGEMAVFSSTVDTNPERVAASSSKTTPPRRSLSASLTG